MWRLTGRGRETWEKGKEIYYTRYGQLELSCANCHEDNNGNMIRADHLSQGQINGFPTYRLKNTKLNGAHSRFKGCIRDTRRIRSIRVAPSLWRWRCMSLRAVTGFRSKGLRYVTNNGSGCFGWPDRSQDISGLVTNSIKAGGAAPRSQNSKIFVTPPGIFSAR